MQIPQDIPPGEAGIRAWLVSTVLPIVNTLLGFGFLDSTGTWVPDNIRGQMVDVTVTSAQRGTQITVNHYLDLPAVAYTVPNVNWLVMGVRTTGAAVGGVVAATSHSVTYDDGVIGPNSIELKFSSSLAADSLVYRLFVMPSTGV